MRRLAVAGASALLLAMIVVQAFVGTPVPAAAKPTTTTAPTTTTKPVQQGIAGYEVVEASTVCDEPLNPICHGDQPLHVDCPAGKVVTGGGWGAQTPAGAQVAGQPQLGALYGEGPVGSNGWELRASMAPAYGPPDPQTGVYPNIPTTYTVRAICVTA